MVYYATGTGFDSYGTNYHLKGNLTCRRQIKLEHVKQIDLFSKLKWFSEGTR